MGLLDIYTLLFKTLSYATKNSPKCINSLNGFSCSLNHLIEIKNSPICKFQKCLSLRVKEVAGLKLPFPLSGLQNDKGKPSSFYFN
jgi:hypothetical protein